MILLNISQLPEEKNATSENKVSELTVASYDLGHVDSDQKRRVGNHNDAVAAD